MAENIVAIRASTKKEMKQVEAVAPFQPKEGVNFKRAAFDAWVELGGKAAPAHYPMRILHGVVFRYVLPRIWEKGNVAKLRFASGYSICFDTFPDSLFYEVIPVIWDCWPAKVEIVAEFFRKNKTQTAIFTSSQTADIFRNMFPQMNILHITEGVNINVYKKGKILKERGIDILEIGRKQICFFKQSLPPNINHLKTGNFARVFKSDEEFREALANTKITMSVPRCDVDKELAGNIETLTQRYWECMLSRVIMIGRAPKELIDLIGYNPVIDWDGNDATSIALHILNNLDDYQELVDKNRETAIKMADWSIRMEYIKRELELLGYNI